MSWQFLSYELSNNLSGYGDGERIKINKSKQICCGDTSNNTDFWMPSHLGTHIDFPYHFSKDGKNGSNFEAKQFVFYNSFIQEIDLRLRKDKLIGPQDLTIEYDSNTELLIFKTFYSEIRENEDYWRNGPGFRPETASLLKKKMPNLKAIAFDSISLTNYQNRELGRIAHHEFLIEYDLLIIEDVDLRNVSATTKFTEVIVSPLRLKGSDGAPVTIFARIEK